MAETNLMYRFALLFSTLSWCGHRNRRHGLARHEVLAAHLVDRQKAHQCAAREPDQQLCADEQREPFMCPTGEHMNAVSIALQNQNLIPATKLTAFGFSPANRA